MNKKVIIICILLIAIIALGAIFLISSNNKDNTNTNQNTANVGEENNNKTNEVANTNNRNEEVLTNNSKTLVVYFSAQSHTKAVAEKIADNLNADLFEIVPKETYTSDDLDWTDNNSRVSREHNNESLRNVELITTKVDNWENYDTVLIGYPIWWGNAAWPVDTFVKANNFNGKTVIPFCTSASSGLGQSGELLKTKANSGNWLEGYRFTSNPTDSAIKTWTDSIR